MSSNNNNNNNNFSSKNYDIDKLSFKKLKSELETIPKLIKNRTNKHTLKPSSSMCNIHNNFIPNNFEDFNNLTNKEQEENKFMEISSRTLAKKSASSNNLFSFKNQNTNFINYENLSLLEKENLNYINNIKKLYEKKIEDIKNFYENKYSNLNKLLLNNINDFKILSSNYIPLTDHENIINEIKMKFNDIISTTKKNYEELISELTDILKNKSKYQDLIQRLQLYKIYEVDIKEIEEKLVINLNDNINERIINGEKPKDEFLNDFFFFFFLDQEINYHRK